MNNLLTHKLLQCFGIVRKLNFTKFIGTKYEREF